MTSNVTESGFQPETGRDDDVSGIPIAAVLGAGWRA